MSEHQVQYNPPSAADLAKLHGLGRFLEENRTPERRRTWRLIMFAVMGLLVILNFIIPNHHPHFLLDLTDKFADGQAHVFGLDAYPLFWPIFGFGVGVIMVFFVKRIVQPLIKRSEDYYGDL